MNEKQEKALSDYSINELRDALCEKVAAAAATTIVMDAESYGNPYVVTVVKVTLKNSIQ